MAIHSNERKVVCTNETNYSLQPILGEFSLLVVSSFVMKELINLELPIYRNVKLQQLKKGYILVQPADGECQDFWKRLLDAGLCMGQLIWTFWVVVNAVLVVGGG